MCQRLWWLRFEIEARASGCELVSCQEARAHTRLHHVASALPAAHVGIFGERLERGHAPVELLPPCIGLVVVDRAPQQIDAGELLPCSSPRATGCEHERSLSTARLPLHPIAFLNEGRPQRDVQFGQRIAALAAAAVHPRGCVRRVRGCAPEVRVSAGLCQCSAGDKAACEPSGYKMFRQRLSCQ